IKPLQQDMSRCDQIVKSLLGEAPPLLSLESALQSTGLPEEDIQSLWKEIITQEVLSRHKVRDESARRKFLSDFLLLLQQQKGDIRRGLLLLKDFIHGTRAKASFFSLLLREPALMQRLAWLFGHSPYLSKILCHRPELLDSFVYRSQDRISSDMATLLEDLAEKRLLSEIINGSEFLENKDLSHLLPNLTSTADSIVLTLQSALSAEYPSSLQLLALGKWGGEELGFRSDLDFIFVAPNEPEENDFKVAKRLISRLTEPHRGGAIYSVDMRLRPSGKAGPLVIALKDLQDYLQHQASAWERQAYTKARWIVPSNKASLNPSLLELFINKGFTASELQELERIRLQLLAPTSTLNLKFSEGGLVDIELAAQTYVLNHHLTPPSTKTADFLTCLPSNKLLSNYNKLRHIEQTLQLVASESLVEVLPNHESFHALAMALQMPSQSLLQELHSLFADNIVILKELDPRRRSH
ncbi:MAG: glutamine-synthetase adenylyltransferase, partial [Bdellovibrio sp.]